MKTQSILNVMVDMRQKEFADCMGVPLNRVRHWASHRNENTRLTPPEKALLKAFCIGRRFVACPNCSRPETFREFQRPQGDKFGFMCPDCRQVFSIDRYNNTGEYKW